VEEILAPVDLLLQLKNAVEQSFGGRRASRDVDVHGDDPVAPPHNGVGVVVVPAAIGAAAHRNNPAGLWHLVIDSAGEQRKMKNVSCQQQCWEAQAGKN